MIEASDIGSHILGNGPGHDQGKVLDPHDTSIVINDAISNPLGAAANFLRDAASAGWLLRIMPDSDDASFIQEMRGRLAEQGPLAQAFDQLVAQAVQPAFIAHRR